MNDKNKKHQAEKKRLKQKKLLLQMTKEIKSLEFEVEHFRLVNAKISTIKNLKIGVRILQKVAPYVLTAGIIAGGFTLLGDTPFYSGDERKVYSKVMTEFDDAGNIRQEQQYASFEDNNGMTLDNSASTLYYYSKWQKNNDEFYSRIVQTYSIKGKTYEDIIELFGQENLKFEDILGEPSSNVKETKNNLTDEELQEESFVKAVIYDKEENNYIMRKTTVGENVGLSLLYVIFTGICELVLLYWRNKYSDFNFKNCVEAIKEKHQLLDVETLTKKIELKRDNYDRLRR